ncbi:MAG: DUF2889 domain-containing protein [Candidatus Puniceispirillaceae bacterium]|jgi:hypothetical protein|nr:DUF2889 domain-containing protein [Alphaproteobacteria bacterium]
MTTDPSSAPKIPAMETPPTPYGAGHVTSLSPAVPREAVHKRQINCNGFVRADGLYDIEAELTDHKTYDFPSDFRGTVTPDLAVHHMVLRITIDRDRVIQHAEAITITGPYAICPTANAVFDNLVGLQIGPGWRRKVQAAIGGRHGCTHITELLGPVATIAYQTLYGEEARQKRQSGTLSDQDKQASRSQLANSCVGYADDSSDS